MLRPSAPRLSRLRKQRLRWTRAVTLVLACAQGACTSLDDLQLATSDVATSCVHATIPQPARIASSPNGSIDFVVAVQAYDHGDLDQGDSTERFRSMGFDLDSTCTGLGQGPSCIKPPWATADDTDGPQGRDNAYGANLYRSAVDGGGSGTLSGNSAIDSGLITTIIRVKGYNGGSVDPEVEVAIYGATMNGAGATSARPAWKGEDTWASHEQWLNEDADGLPSIELPKYFDARAYVVDSILVAQLDYLFVPVQELSQVKMTARIVWQDGGWFLVDGTVAGRTKPENVLGALDLLKDPETLETLCTDSPSYPAIKRTICAATDISYSGPDDGSMPCDATSWAWEFTAAPARLAGIQRSTIEQFCPPDRLPDNDRCSTLE